MNDDVFRMNRFTLRFVDAAVEAAYAAEHARKSVRQIRISIVALVAIMALTYLLAIFGIIPAGKITGRSGAAVIVFSAILYALSRRPLFLDRQQPILLALFCLLSAMLIVGSSHRSAEFLVLWRFPMMLFLMFSIYSLARLRFPLATMAGSFHVAAYVGYIGSFSLLDGPTLGGHGIALGLANLWGMLICYQMDGAERREYVAQRQLNAAMLQLGEERERSERLLLNILPAPIAERLKATGEAIAEHSDGVTVLFSDIVGFTPLSANKTPQALVELLNRIFSEFDALADAHGLEKIKTIGDAYMAVAGLPNPWPDHASRAARMALAMHDVIARVTAETGEKLALRIGLHSGPVVAGVIGRRKFAYDLWGDTVNTASRMESHGVPGSVHCSETTAMLLQGAFQLQARGAMEIKGKGEMYTFLVLNREGAPTE